MSSKTRRSIEIQKGFYEEAFLRRQAELKDRNLEDGKITRDPQLRHLRAKVRQANRRLFAISKIEKQIEVLASRKGKKATGKPEELKSSKKLAPETSKKKPKDEKATPTD